MDTNTETAIIATAHPAHPATCRQQPPMDRFRT
jgi:hypothetical protein